MTKFTEGDELFGQLFEVPLGSTGTYAEYVAAPEDAPLVLVPRGLDPVVAASLPTSGGTALNLADSLQPLTGKTILVVGAPGKGLGSRCNFVPMRLCRSRIPKISCGYSVAITCRC